MVRRLPDLDQISLDLMIEATRRLGVRGLRRGVQRCAKLQIGIREAMRDALPEDDPRRDPSYPFSIPDRARAADSSTTDRPAGPGKD